MLNTDVMVAAMRSATGASRRLLVAGLTGRIELLVSVPLVFEYEAVMTRPSHLLASRLAVLEVGELIDAVLSVATPVMLDFLWRPVLADADDDMVLETAVNGSADWLVTFNRRDFALAVRQFAVIVCSPGEAVGMLEMDR